MKRLLALSPTGVVSGAEVVLLRLLTAAAHDGFRVTCASPPGPLSAELGRAGVIHVDIPDLKLPSGHPTVALPRLAARTVGAAIALRRLAREADVVLVNGFFALPALRLASIDEPSVWLVHDVIHRRSWQRILRHTKRAVSVAIAVSEAAAEPLRRLGMDVRVVRNGTPWPVAAAPGRRSDPYVIGSAAMLTSWKGQDVLLEAVALLGRADLALELAGGQFPKDGPYVERLRARAAQPDLAGRVAFLGPVSDTLDRIRSWTVMVSPSVDPEAGPLVALEAMSVGVPVVATDHGGVAEVVGEAGLLVPPRRADLLAGAIERLLDDADLWDRCHRAGPAQISAGLTLDRQIPELLMQLESAAAWQRRS